MRKIECLDEPEELTHWKIANPAGDYTDLPSDVRRAIRLTNTQGQYYLCAYCCQEITGTKTDCMNEHVEARSIAPHRSLDFDNIVASCTKINQCDKAHKAQHLPLTPLMSECESEFQFYLSGRVKGITDRAKTTITVLNLGDTEENNNALIERRKALIHILLFTNGVNHANELDDDELIQIVIDDINSVKDGKLSAFSPALTNVLRSWLQGP